MTKLRSRQLIAVQVEYTDVDGRFTGGTMKPLVMPGGPHSEHNRRALADGMRETMCKYDPDCEWRARIIYHWRSPRHLWRWIDLGNSFWKGRAT